MKKQRFSEEQIVRMLRQAETSNQTVAEVCKQHGVCEQTWYRWKKQFGQMEVPDVRRLRELEKENSRLKRIVAERDPDTASLIHELQVRQAELQMQNEGLLRSEQRYRSLFENAREAFVLTNREGNITDANRLVEEYSFQKQALIGRNLLSFVAEEHRARALADFEILLGGKPVHGEMDVVTPKGIFSVEYRDNPIFQGDRIVGVQVILTDVTKRRLAEQRLREERDRAQQYLDIAGVMIVAIDSEGRVGLINRKGCEILEYTEQDVLGKNWFSHFLSPRVRESVRTVWGDLMSGRVAEHQYVEGPVLTRSGRERITGWHNTVLKDKTGRIIGTLSSGQDITERRQAEEACRSLVDHSLQGLVIFQDGRAVFVNQAMAGITGYTADEILAMSVEQIREFVHPADRESVWENHRRRLAGEPVPKHYQMCGVRKDGSVCWLDIYASRIDYRGKPAIQAAYIDTTERKRAEEALRLSEERYRGIFENAVLGMYQATPDGEILAANPALVRMLGYDTFEELASRNLEEEGFEPEYLRSLFKERVEANDQIVGLESAWKRRDGSTLWARESARAVRDEMGKTLFYEGTVEDITERKHADHLVRMLAATAMELVELPLEADLFQFIGEKILALIGEGIVSVNSIEGDTLTVRQIAGATTAAMKLAQRLLGGSVIDMPITGLHATARTRLLSGKLIKVEGGLHELFFHSVARPICWTLEKSLGIKKCHSIGLRRPGRLLGSITILAQKRTSLNAGVIEAFVNQASIALERRMAVEALMKTEERFRTLYESVQAGVIVQQADGTIVHANQVACDIFGITREAVQAKPSVDLDWQMILEDGTPVSGEDHPSMITLRTGEPIRGAVRGLFSNDPSRLRWLMINTEPLHRSDDGDVEHVMVTFHDITERRRAEEALRESEIRYRLLADNASDIIWTADMDLHRTYCSPSVKRVLGYTPDEILAKRVDEIMTPASLELIERAHADEMEIERNGQADPLRSRTIEIEEVRKDGTTCWVEVKAGFLRDASDKAIGIVGVTRDITDRKRLEREVVIRERQLNSFFTGATAGLALLDRDLRYMQINDTLAEMNGVPVKDHIGRTVREVVPHIAPMVEPYFQRVLTTGESVLDVEVSGSTRDQPGVHRYCVESFFPIAGAEGVPEGVGVIMVEITGRKRVEQLLLKYQSRLRRLVAELMLTEERERARIATGVHDQIGQRLALAKLTLQMLGPSLSEASAVQTLEWVCNEIDQVLKDAHSLTFELGNPMLHEIGLVGAVESWLMDHVHGKYGIECTFTADKRLAGLDRETSITLFHIVCELLTNVIKHAKAKRVDVCIRRIGGMVQIAVQDNGIGFQPVKDSRIISKSGGFGLLSVREKLDYLGGSTTIESEPGKGSRVVIAAPLKDVRHAEEKETSS